MHLSRQQEQCDSRIIRELVNDLFAFLLRPNSTVKTAHLVTLNIEYHPLLQESSLINARSNEQFTIQYLAHDA